MRYPCYIFNIAKCSIKEKKAMIEIIPNWHPIFVHFTVALVTISGVFFILAKLIGDKKVGDELLASARWSLWAGGIFAIVTVAAGFFAYYSVGHDTLSHLKMTAHRNWALVTLVAALTCVGWSLIHYWRNTKPTLFFIVAMLAVLILVATTGWRGGELVYRYGIGVMSLPQSSEIEHQHNHGEMLEESSHHPKNEAPETNKKHEEHKH